MNSENQLQNQGQTQSLPKWKDISQSELNGLGINKESSKKIYNTSEELRKGIPNIVIGECTTYISFNQNNYHVQQELIKKQKYVMSLGIYHQLHFDTQRNIKILKPSQVKFRNIYKPYTGQDLTNKTILVWRTGGIGDLLFIQPNLIYLKEKYPTCRIVFACGPQYQSMVKEWDFVDEVINLPINFRYVLEANYHVIFEGLIERTKEGEQSNAYRLFTKWMGLNLPDEKLVPTGYVNPESLDRCKKVLDQWGIEKPIMVQLRASSPIRTPRPEVFKKIVNELTSRGHNVVFTDSPKMIPYIDSFVQLLDNPEKVFNFAVHSKEIADSIALASLSKLIIGTDSAMMHIGISVGTKIFGIYGPFPGDIRLSTYPKDRCDWIDVKDECAPCYIHSMVPCSNCVNKFSKCYDNIDVEESLSKIERLLG